MISQADFDAAVNELVNVYGFERDKARAQVERQLGRPKQASRYALSVESSFAGHVDFLPDPPAGSLVSLPFRLTLPWSALCSDNDHYAATLRKIGPAQTPTPLLVMKTEYRKAKDAIEQLARRTVAGAQPLEQPLTLLADVWVPDNRPHDVTNFAKCAHDALERIVYANDKWLYRATWQRAGVDVDRPRAEITITLHSPGQ